MAAPITGQVSVTASAQRLSATQVNCTAFLIKVPSSNNHPVYIGPSTVTTANGYPLLPGEAPFSYERQQQLAENVYPLEPSDFYVIGTVGDVVAWLASP